MKESDRVSTGIIGLDNKMQGGLVRGSANLLAGKTGTGKCIAPHTPVLLSNGDILTAEEVFNKNFSGNTDADEIYSPTNDLELFSVNPDTLKIEKKKASHIYRQRIKESMVRVTTSSNRVLETTKAHKFLSIVNGQVVYKESSCLCTGDYVAVPRTIKMSSGDNHDTGLKRDIAEFMALQIAEGDEWSKKTYYLRFYNEDPVKLNAYCMLARRLFNYSPKICQQKGKTPHVRIFSKGALDSMRSLGFIPCKKSKDKDIPSIILTSDDETVSLFLRTFYDCEGTVGAKLPEINVTTASRSIANKVSYLLMRFGIVARVDERWKAATNGANIKRKYYTVRVSGVDNIQKFHLHIGFGDEGKASRVLAHLSKTSNTNVDIIPEIGGLIRGVRNGLKIPAGEMGIGGKQNIYMYEWGERKPSRPMLGKFITGFRDCGCHSAMPSGMILLERLACSDIFWDRIKWVEEFKPDYAYVYDFTVEDNHNFVSGFGGIITHNTAFAVSFLYKGALEGEPGIYVTTEENEADIKKDITSMFGWDMEALEKKKLLKFLFIRPVLPMKKITDEQLAQTTKIYVFDISDKIRQAVRELKAKRVVVDSVSIIEMFIKDEYISKVALMQFVENMKTLGVTSLLTGTIPETTDALSGKGIVEYVVDSIIKLNLIPVTEEFKRTLLIRKMRRTDHSTLVHPFEMTKNGLKVIDVKDI